MSNPNALTPENCPCGCPPDMHVGEIGCPCALPGEPPCAPDAADEREALVEVAANAIIDVESFPDNSAHGHPGHCAEHAARAVLDAVADRLVALGEHTLEVVRDQNRRLAETLTEETDRRSKAEVRLAEVEAERDRIRKIAAEHWEKLGGYIEAWGPLLARAERAEADLAAAEQRGGERALREAAANLPMFLDIVRRDDVWGWLRDRADRLGTQAEGEAL